MNLIKPATPDLSSKILELIFSGEYEYSSVVEVIGQLEIVKAELISTLHT